MGHGDYGSLPVPGSEGEVRIAVECCPSMTEHVVESGSLKAEGIGLPRLALTTKCSRFLGSWGPRRYLNLRCSHPGPHSIIDPSDGTVSGA